MLGGSLQTQLVGSYSKPGWLFARERHPFHHQQDAWRVPAEHLKAAHDDATALAIAEQEYAGLDIITDGEQRRAGFDLYFLRYGGIDTERLGPRTLADRDTSGSDVRPEFAAAFRDPKRAVSPRVFEKIRWEKPLSVDDFIFLRGHTHHPTKITVLGPLTSACRLSDDYYQNFGDLVMDLADAVNQELRALESAGVDLIQLDEPDAFLRRSRTRGLTVAAINRALEGITTPVIVHVCHGYPTSAINKRASQLYVEVLESFAQTRADGISLEWEEPHYSEDILSACGEKMVLLGVLDLGTERIETVDYISSRIRQALRAVPFERLGLAPDCGMWHMPRERAFRKLRAMVMSAEIMRSELQ